MPCRIARLNYAIFHGLVPAPSSPCLRLAETAAASRFPLPNHLAAAVVLRSRLSCGDGMSVVANSGAGTGTRMPSNASYHCDIAAETEYRKRASIRAAAETERMIEISASALRGPPRPRLRNSAERSSGERAGFRTLNLGGRYLFHLDPV